MKLLHGIAPVFIVAGMAGCAFHGSPVPDEKNDVIQYALIAPVPLSQAILAAEDRTVGKAIRGELVRDSGKMRYRVLITAQGKMHTVSVDPASGQDLAVTP